MGASEIMISSKPQRFIKVWHRFGLGVFVTISAQLFFNLNPVFVPLASAKPNTLTLSVYPFDSREKFPICPTEVKLTEASRPYYEGGYTRDGSGSLGWLAREFKVTTKDDFSVIWSAKLQTKYRNCRGTATVTQIDGESFEGISHLRMRFVNGTVYLILDMTGKRDANGLTTVITKHGIKNGQPFWSWSGTD
jgi:hypothetical protein